MLLFRILLLTFVIFINVHGKYLVELNDTQDTYVINKGVLYLEDPNTNLCINALTRADSDFKVMEKEELSFGFTSSVYWFKIPIIDNSRDKLKQWWLDIDYTLLDNIQVYQEDENGVALLLHTGDEGKFSHRSIKWRTYSAILDTSKPSTLYVRVQTQSSMQVPIKIYTSSEIVSKKQAETLFYGFYYGIVLLIIFYNIFLFFVWNDRNYLYYIAFIGSFMMWQLCIDGLGHQYLWPEVKWLSEKGVLLFIGLSIFSAVLFTRSFLHLREYATRLNLVLISVQSFMLVLIVGSFILPYSLMIQILVWLIFPTPLLLLYAGVVALKNRYQYARFYIMGWTLFLGASVLLALNSLGLIGGYAYIKYVQPVGSLAEIMFFSLALAERINLLRQQNLKTLSRLNSRLQSEVHEKVCEIREKDELLMQKFRLATMGEMLENISHQWKQPLNKLSLVLQNYYFKYKLEGANTQELESLNEQSSTLLNYMSSTIDDFRNFFNPQKEKEAFEVLETIDKVLNIISSSIDEQEIDISIKHSSNAVVYGYPNEFGQVLLNLFSNAKDAFSSHQNEKKSIKIDISEKDNEIVISFLDNAGGIAKEVLPKIFDPYFSTKGFKEGSGIGLYMSKMIIENSMHGKFNVENRKTGAEFIIRLPKVL